MFLTMDDIRELHDKLKNGEDIPKNFPYIYALSDDKQSFAVIRTCRIDREANGRLSYFFPNSEGNGENIISCFILDADNWTSGYPIPDSFEVKNASFEGNKLKLESQGGKTIVFERFMPNLDSPASIEELEKDFFECGKAPQENKKDTNKFTHISVLGIGRMNYDPFGEYFVIRKNEIDFRIDVLPSAELKKAKKNLKYVYNELSTLINTAKLYTAKELLPVKNESWLNENESPLTETEFVSKMTLSSVSADDEEISLIFNDNEMFFGHDIEVVLTNDGRAISAEIIG